MPFDVDKAKPADDDVVSQYPANERGSREQIEAWMDFEHDAASGRHKFTRGGTATRDGITDWSSGSLFINDDFSPPRLQIRQADEAWASVGEFASGTRMVFAQASAPTGWTQDTDETDRVLRLVNHAGGGTGGSWTISGLTHAHTHPFSVPNHSHAVPLGEDSSGGNRFPVTHPAFGRSGQQSSSQSFGRGTDFITDTVEWLLSGSAGSHSSNTSGASSSAVSSDASWRPRFTNVIVAVKN